MATKVILPHMGLTTLEGTIVQWLKREGDAVTRGEPLVEVVTDKVSTQVEAPESGTLLRIVAAVDTVVPVTETLCWLGQPGEVLPGTRGVDAETRGRGDAERGTQDSGPRTQHSEPRTQNPELNGDGYLRASPIAKRLAREHGIDLAEVTGTGTEGRIVEADVLRFVQLRRAEVAPEADTARVSPMARNTARELGIDLRAVDGSGPGGRITREDVLLAAEKAKSAAVAPAPEAAPVPVVPSPATASATVPMVGLRRTIAQRMAQSSQTVARVTHTTEVDVTETVRMREQLVEESEKLHGLRVSYTDLLVKMVARALRRHPMMNARLDGDQIHLVDRVNVGVAVAVPEGLVVPVIHDADEKELIDIARESRDKAERARTGKLTHDDVAEGTFTVTNLGAFEIDAFTPIVNLPEVGILGVGRIVEKPAIFQGEIAKRSMMYLSLSFDHRVIDGAPAAEFLRTVKHALEKPYTLLI